MSASPARGVGGVRPEARVSPGPLAGPEALVSPDVRFDSDGLVAGIVQDVADGRVLMLGWLDAEALTATLATGLVHFHSRSRDRLWRKGETSGNQLHLVDLAADCDADALLLTVRPTGPTCHTGARSCFDPPPAEGSPSADVADGRVGTVSAAGADQEFAILERLWRTIVERAAERPVGSYTVRLLDGGVDAVGRKVVEEATEVLMAAKDDAVAEADRRGSRAATRTALAGELADLLYHTLVLCQERGLPPREALAVLRQRHSP